MSARVHPVDRNLRLSCQGRSDMTTLGSWSLKVRVNGGAATTYTSVSSPALAAFADDSSSVLIDIAASTYANGDKLEWVWLYASARVAVGSATIGPAAPLDAAATATAAALSTLDDYVDTEVAAIKAKTDLIPAAGPADAAVWTSTVAGRIDAAVSSRLATAGYTAPDNAGVAAVKAKTDNLPAAPAATGDIPSAATIAAAVWAVAVSGLTSAGTVGKRIVDFLDAAVSSVKAKTDGLPSDPADASDIAALVDALPTAAEAAAAVWAAETRTLTSGSAPSAAAIADAVWGEALSGHTTAGTAGKALSDAGGAASAETIANEVVSQIGAGRVTVVSPVSADGSTVEVYKGDDYANAQGRALTFNITGAGDLTTYTSFSFTVDGELAKTASAVDADTLRVADISAADLAGLEVKGYSFDVSGVKGGNTRTLVRGVLVVRGDISG